MNARDMRALMAQYGLRPNKGLGQNFLVDESYLRRIAAAAELSPGDTVLEIGPGLGPLTALLLEASTHVTAVEVDRGFIPLLRDRFGAEPNFSLLHQDILQTELPDALVGADGMTPSHYKCVANIPYYITSAVMRHLLESTLPPHLIVLLVQREVAQRIVAAPGDLSLLAVSVQLYGEPEIVATMPAGAFYPPPKVDSAILRIRPFAEPLVSAADRDAFFSVVRAGFGQKRKQLKNSLQAGLPHRAAQVPAALDAVGIDPRRRAETLSIEEWARLSAALHDGQ